MFCMPERLLVHALGGLDVEEENDQFAIKLQFI